VARELNMTKSVVWLISFTLAAQTRVVQSLDDGANAQATARLRSLLDAAPQAICIVPNCRFMLHRTDGNWG
jgi:hypothetical protein